jgi:hypothetical protein
MLLKNPDVGWSDIPDLPKAACVLLEQQFSRCTSKVLRCQQSTGGDTTKLLIQLQDGMQVEAVLMHYDTSGAGCCPVALLCCYSWSFLASGDSKQSSVFHGGVPWETWLVIGHWLADLKAHCVAELHAVTR